MKKSLALYISILFLIVQISFAQQIENNRTTSEKTNPIVLESGINLSIPVHIEMYRTHRVGIGINIRASKKISAKTALGIRAEYDYRFARNLPPDTTNTVEGRALHKNFSLIALKPNVQFSLKSNWFIGVETGVGYVISDENNTIGFGFVSEYAGNLRVGSCSGLYLGKYFTSGKRNNQLGISLNLTNFVAKGHAENTLGLKFNYCFHTKT
jgi:long-subunit fatty acid transport protein